MTGLSRARITHIEWERIFLHIDIESDMKDALCAVRNAATNVELPLETSRTDKGYSVCVNIACVSDREFLENGRWYFVLKEKGKAGETVIEQAGDSSGKGSRSERVAVTSEVAGRVAELTRIFRYAENQMAYTLSFGIETEDEENLEIYMDSYFMEENKKWKKRRYVKEVRSANDKLKRIAMSGAIKGIAAWYHTVDSLTPKTGKNVLLMSETHDYLWGNLKAIDDEIKKQGLDKEYNVSYSFRKKVGKHQTLGDAPSWFRTTTLIAKQDIIFVDDYAPIFGFFQLGQRTKLIQVWHAGEGFKAVGYARFGKEGSPFPQKSCHKQYTNAIVGSEHLRDVFSEVFGIEKEACLPLGMPRMDGFLDEQRQQRIRDAFADKYPNTKGQRLILFAPTYRGAEQKEAYYDYSWLDLAAIYAMCEKTDSVWVFKMHPFVKEEAEIPAEFADRIMQLGSTENINDLYYVTDVLVTDYSSNYYEFALTGGACVFFTPDREIYELTRGVHRSVLECAPGKICDTFDELIKALEEGDYEIDKTKQFVIDNYGDYTGDASAKVVERFLK